MSDMLIVGRRRGSIMYLMYHGWRARERMHRFPAFALFVQILNLVTFEVYG